MDNTGGDVEHAALTMNEKIEELPSSNDAQGTRDNVEAANKEHELQSSDSSSSDSISLEKLDSAVIKVKEVKEGDEMYAHLPEHERDIVKRQLDIPQVNVNYKKLYRYETKTDMIIIAVSAICAIAGGAVLPLMTVSYLE